MSRRTVRDRARWGHVWLSDGTRAQACLAAGPCADAGTCVCGFCKGAGQCGFGDCRNRLPAARDGLPPGSLCTDCSAYPWRAALPGHRASAVPEPGGDSVPDLSPAAVRLLADLVRCDASAGVRLINPWGSSCCWPGAHDDHDGAAFRELYARGLVAYAGNRARMIRATDAGRRVLAATGAGAGES